MDRSTQLYWTALAQPLHPRIDPKPQEQQPPLMEVEELDECAFCGFILTNPCYSPPPGICDRALDALSVAQSDFSGQGRG